MSPKFCDFHNGNGEEIRRCKFFEIGIGRCATRSIYVAARKLKLVASHGAGCPMCLEDAMKKMAQGSIDLDSYKNFDYVGHLPSFHWKQLAEERSDSRFILPIRPLNDLDDCVGWVNRYCKKVTRRGGKRKDPRRVEFIRSKLFGFKYPKEVNKKELKLVLREGFLNHVEQVTDFFKKESHRLCILDVFTMKDDELWKKLSKFIGVDCPEIPFPKKLTPIRFK